MANAKAVLRWVLAGIGVALLLALTPSHAAAGAYTVANCASDPTGFNTRAFGQFETRGMVVKRWCTPKGKDPRGLIVGNAVRRGTVKRGATARVTIEAPAGTRFVKFLWSGLPVRSDCRYALQMWAEVPGGAPVSMVNKRANRDCPKKRKVQIARYPEKEYALPGATRIVQRVVCVGGKGRQSCSTTGKNELWTFRAAVTVEDVAAPSVAIRADTPLTRGEWINGDQLLNYEASDNVGVRSADAILGGIPAGSDDRPCRFAIPGATFADLVPCTNGPGTIVVTTALAGEGTHPLIVRAQDPAGNTVDSTPITARIDRTPPGRVNVGVVGGDAWRSRNDFVVAWTNPAEVDRAPIVGAVYRLCKADGGSCTRGEQAGAGLSRLGVPVPGPGQWTISLWRRDAAGNESDRLASVPVTLRYDPDPPKLGFEPPAASDPALVALKVNDEVSGVADASIEISSAGSGVWRTLPAERTGDRLLARIDDAALPPGVYELRARAVDLARNEASTNLRLDGQPMTLSLPIRIVSSMQTAFERQRIERSKVRRKGKTRTVNRRATVHTQTARVLFGETAQVVGRLVNTDGNGIAGAEIHVLSTPAFGPEQLLAVLHTDAEGSYRYTASGSANRTLRFVYAGSRVVLPTQSELAMTVPAASSLRVSARRLRNGQTVTFSGPVRSGPMPPGGKLVEMQVRLPGRWETFRTVRSDEAGNWSVRYRFRRTYGVRRYRFRARLPAEGAYPFTTGVTRVVTVTVRGR